MSRLNSTLRIARWNELIAVPWKNGHGITREIAKEFGDSGFVWRLSIADVDGDGPFSTFKGMRRILTVVAGKGMELVGSDHVLQADLGVPVEFKGDTGITSRLKNGPLRDLNLIYDPTRCCGIVSLIRPGEHHLQSLPGQTLALHCMAGAVDLDLAKPLFPGDTALLETGALDFEVTASSAALLVSVERHF
jgi:uncharacterized protein